MTPRTTFPTGWFLARITNISAAPAYQFQEQWVTDDAGTVADKTGGRYGGADNPGFAVNGAVFAVNDLALCRSADGVGGLVWELVPLSGGSAALSHDEHVFDANYTLTATNAWTDPGFTTLDLPAAGTYLLYAKVSYGLKASAISAVTGNYGAVRLYDQTTPAVISGGTFFTPGVQVVNVYCIGSLILEVPYTAPGPVTIRIEVFRPLVTTWTTTEFGTTSGPIGGSSIVLGYVRLD